MAIPTLLESTEAWRAEDTINDRARLKALLDALLPDGLQGKKLVFGTAAFTTTGTTKEVPVTTLAGEELATIEAAIVVPKATHAADERFFCDGDISAGTPDTTTISRAAASPTSGLAFWYILIGT